MNANALDSSLNLAADSLSSKLNPAMVRLAREARGLTQKELADRLAIKQGTLSKIENGQHTATEPFLKSLTEALDFPSSFFFQRNNSFAPRTIYYRRLVQIPKKHLYQAEAQMDICRFGLDRLLRAVELANNNLVKWNVDESGDAESCARYVRQHWQLPKGAIPNLTNVAEKNGIIVVHLEMDKSINGFSNVTESGQPIIFLNRGLSADRMRFTLAHEIGHLTMHFLDKPISKDRDTEEEANRFAAEFMAPELEVRHHLQRLDIQRLRELKRFWKMSMQMLLYRAKELKCIPDHQYRSLITKLGYEGYRVNEPVEFPHEEPVLTQAIVNMHLRDLGYTRESLAELLNLYPGDIDTFFSQPVAERKMRLAI